MLNNTNNLYYAESRQNVLNKQKKYEKQIPLINMLKEIKKRIDNY